MDSLGIYISVPFCRAKCSYCNFASGVAPAGAHEQYVSQVCGEIRTVRQPRDADLDTFAVRHRSAPCNVAAMRAMSARATSSLDCGGQSSTASAVTR